MGTWRGPWGHWDHGNKKGTMGTWGLWGHGGGYGDMGVAMGTLGPWGRGGGHGDMGQGEQRGTQGPWGHEGDTTGTQRGQGGGATGPPLTLPCRCRLLLRNSRTSSSVSFCGGGTGTRGHLRGRVSPPGGCHPHPADPPPATHQRVAALGQGDELLVGGRAHVEADGQHLLQGGHDERGVDGVAVAPALLLRPLLLRAAPLGTGTGASAPPSTDMGWGHRQSHGGGGGEAAGSVVEAMGSWSRPWGPHQGHGVMVKAMGIPLLRPWGHDQGHGVMVKVMGTPSRSWGHH